MPLPQYAKETFMSSVFHALVVAFVILVLMPKAKDEEENH